VQEDEPGNDTYPPEALQYWPKEVLDALPKVMIRFLRIRDYQALDAACPQEDAAGIGACLETEAAQNVLGEQFGRAVVSTLVGYMDAELPNRLAEEDFDAIAEPCEKTGEAWANCILEVIEKDLDADKCDQAEDDLATCIVGHDKVSETFLAIQKERKEVFGPDVFVAFRGLLSVLTIEDLKALRAACPQDDVDALLTCLDGNEVVKAMVDVFQQITQVLVEETQTELTAAGKPMSEEQAGQLGERVLDLLFRFPSRVIDNVAKECDTKHPELAKLDDPTKIDQSLQCLEDEAQIDPIANPAYISAALHARFQPIAVPAEHCLHDRAPLIATGRRPQDAACCGLTTGLHRRTQRLHQRLGLAPARLVHRLVVMPRKPPIKGPRVADQLPELRLLLPRQNVQERPPAARPRRPQRHLQRRAGEASQVDGFPSGLHFLQHPSQVLRSCILAQRPQAQPLDGRTRSLDPPRPHEGALQIGFLRIIQ
jgi:hypothetical protein